jgi:SAM-dependent methyltransferase
MNRDDFGSRESRAHERLRAALRTGAPILDDDFDIVYAPEYRRASRIFWTSVGTARRVAEFFEGEGTRRVLDVGSGVGKLCIVAAAHARRTSFIGVEHRAHLVGAARAAAAMLGSTRVEFVHQPFADLDTRGFDGFYFYNPFGENLFTAPAHLDGRVELSSDRYRRDVGAAQRAIALAPRGTCLVTFWEGIGDRPTGYTRIHTERSRGGELTLWRKLD